MIFPLAAALFVATGIAAQPSILLLSVDTLRADRLGCYGYDLPTSPNLDRLATTSLLFEDAICEIPLTSPSMGSMLSSRYPRMNGATRNGLPMPDCVPLVAERFQAAGYFTFCVQSNWTLKAKLSGLDRGFTVYDDGFHKKRWGFIKAERDAEEVTRLALELLEKRDPARSFFAWVHYSDPHAPYKMHRQHNPSGKRTWRLSNEQRVRVKYDSEVAHTDAEIGKLLEQLPEDVYVVFVADHGESLYEHDYLGHGRRIYQHEVRIPLMLHGKGIDPGRTGVPARGIDIAPTLLALGGLSIPSGMLGQDLLGEDYPQARSRVIETYGGAVPNLPGAHALMADAAPMRQAVLSLDRWKLILNGRDAELYDLSKDPGELEDLASREPEKVEALRALITAWDAETAKGAVIAEDLDAADLKALESLGYLE